MGRLAAKSPLQLVVQWLSLQDDKLQTELPPNLVKILRLLGTKLLKPSPIQRKFNWKMCLHLKPFEIESFQNSNIFIFHLYLIYYHEQNLWTKFCWCISSLSNPQAPFPFNVAIFTSSSVGFHNNFYSLMINVTKEVLLTVKIYSKTIKGKRF